MERGTESDAGVSQAGVDGDARAGCVDLSVSSGWMQLFRAGRLCRLSLVRVIMRWDDAAVTTEERFYFGSQSKDEQRKGTKRRVWTRIVRLYSTV